MRSRLEKEMEAVRREKKQLAEENHVSTSRGGWGLLVVVSLKSRTKAFCFKTGNIGNLGDVAFKMAMAKE